MVKVFENTDNEYYMDGYLKHAMDVAKEQIKNDWDFLFVYDGIEGCLSGDTIIRITRNKLARKYPLRYVYQQFHEQSKVKKKWELSHKSYTRSLKGNYLGLNEIVGVKYSGQKKVYMLTLKNGMSLKGTYEHKIMTNKGWVELCNLLECKVMIDTPNARKNNSRMKGKARDFTISGVKFHPYAPQTRKLLEIHRAVFEANLNKLSLKEYLRIICMESTKASKLLYVDTTKYLIHHKDGDHYNNDISNLEMVSKKEHLAKHGYDNYLNFNQGIPEFVDVASIEECGIEDTYDIECKDYHNFTANEIIVHNSGKSVKAMQDAYYCNPELTIAQYAFNPKEFEKAIKTTPKFHCVIYDEAHGGLNSRAAMTMVNRSLVTMLTEIRQKNLFVFVVLPTFFDLDKYVALWRSRALIHVYTKDNFQRGFFAFYNVDRKKELYVNGKKLYSYRGAKPNFIGRFTKFMPLDEADYRKRKYDALINRNATTEDEEVNALVKQLFFDRVMRAQKMSNVQKIELLDISSTTFYERKKEFDEKEQDL